MFSPIGAVKSWIQRGRQALAGLPIREFSIRPRPGDPNAYEEYRRREQAVAAQVDQYQAVPKYPSANFESFARTGYRGNEVVRRAVDVICESATQADLELQDAEGRVVGADSPTAHQEVAAQLRELFTWPSGPDLRVVTGEQILWRLWQDWMICGNGFLEWVPSLGTGRPLQIWRMDPRRVAIEPHPEEWIARYWYRIGGQWWPIPRESVIHVSDYDLVDDYFGLPRLWSGRRTLAVDSEITDMFKVYVQNHGVPPVALQYPLGPILEHGESVQMSREDRNEIIEAWRQSQGGSRRGEPAIAWGFEIKLLGLDFEKLAVSKLLASSEARIAQVFGVPLMLLGRSGDLSDPTHTNFREAREHFVTTTIAALTKRLAAVLTSNLIPVYDPSLALRIALSLSKIDIVREARLRRAGEAAKVFASGLASRHTCQRLAGLPPEGEDAYVPIGKPARPETT